MEKLNNRIPYTENEYLCGWKFAHVIFPHNISLDLVFTLAVFVLSSLLFFFLIGIDWIIK